MVSTNFLNIFLFMFLLCNIIGKILGSPSGDNEESDKGVELDDNAEADYIPTSYVYVALFPPTKATANNPLRKSLSLNSSPIASSSSSSTNLNENPQAELFKHRRSLSLNIDKERREKEEKERMAKDFREKMKFWFGDNKKGKKNVERAKAMGDIVTNWYINKPPLIPRRTNPFKINRKKNEAKNNFGQSSDNQSDQIGKNQAASPPYSSQNDQKGKERMPEGINDVRQSSDKQSDQIAQSRKNGEATSPPYSNQNDQKGKERMPEVRNDVRQSHDKQSDQIAKSRKNEAKKNYVHSSKNQTDQLASNRKTDAISSADTKESDQLATPRMMKSNTLFM